MAEGDDISTFTASGVVLPRRPKDAIVFIGSRNTKPLSIGWPMNDALHDDNDDAAKNSFVLIDQRTGIERMPTMAPVIASAGP
jgi:hypothetical protein